MKITARLICVVPVGSTRPNYTIFLSYTFNMRLLGYAFLIAIFLANTVILTAWANPHYNDHAIQVEKTTQTDHHAQMASDKPCDEMKMNADRDDTDMKHCKGICLCKHVTAQPSPLLNSDTAFYVPSDLSALYRFSDDAFITQPSPLLKRPPRA